MMCVNFESYTIILFLVTFLSEWCFEAAKDKICCKLIDKNLMIENGVLQKKKSFSSLHLQLFNPGNIKAIIDNDLCESVKLAYDKRYCEVIKMLREKPSKTKSYINDPWLVNENSLPNLIKFSRID